MRIKILFIIFAILLIASPSWAATVWIAQTQAGDFSGSNCANAMSIATYNSGADDDDIGIMCDGTYTTAPVPAGTAISGHPITYISQYEHNGSGSQYGVIIRATTELSGPDYIVYDGLYWYNMQTAARWAYMQTGSDYITFQNCKFSGAPKYQGLTWSGTVGGMVDNCEFPDANYLIADNDDECGAWTDGSCQASWDAKDESMDSELCGLKATGPQDMIRVHEGATGVVIKDSSFGYSSHNSISIYSGTNVIKGNTFANTFHRNIGINYTNTKALIEDNIIKDGGSAKYNNPECRDRMRVDGDGIQMTGGSNSIIRKNQIYNNDTGFSFGATVNQLTNNVRFYNNTVVNNEFQIMHSGNTSYQYNGNILKNNIIFDDGNRISHDLESADCGSHRGFSAWVNCADPEGIENYFDNNLFTNGVSTIHFKGSVSEEKTLAEVKDEYPLEFLASNIDTDGPDFTDTSAGDFTLTATSDAIDAGTWLTTITSATGSGTTFTVADAKYFYDGWGISGEAGDKIKTENGQTGTIESINYGTGQITLTSAISWIGVVGETPGEGVALIYNGTKPDIGAEEYGGTPPAPCENFSPANGVEGVSITTHLTFDFEPGETFDVYFDYVDGTTLKCDDDDDGDCDPGTLNNDDVGYWKVHANTADQDFGPLTFTTIGTPAGVGAAAYNAGAGAGLYNAGAGAALASP